MLRARVLVALLGVPVGVLVLIAGGYVFFGAVVLVGLLAMHEYYSLVRPYRPNLLVGYLAGLAVLIGAYFEGVSGALGGILSLFVLLFLWSQGPGLGDHTVGRMGVSSLGVVWIALGLAHLVLLRNEEHGLAFTLLAIGCTWANDTVAFFAGRIFGRRPMSPRVSPGKTMEGAVGGLIGSVLFALLVKLYAPWLPLDMAALLGLLIGLAGQWGDLFESAVKRDLGAKDTGKLLPGHGGMLDRFDSVIFAGVTTYWGVVVLLGGFGTGAAGGGPTP